MEAVSRYKRLINDIGAVFSLFLSYKNTDHTHYKQLVKNWGVGEECSLLSEVEAFSVEELKHELYSLDGKPLKRFIDDLWCYLPDYNKELYCLAHDKEIFSLLEDIHGGKNARLIIDNLIAIGITATKTKINRVALILDELQPQQQTPQEPSTERAKKAFKLALEAGYMEETDTGYRWLFMQNKKGHQASLGYFLRVVYNPDGASKIPYKQLEELFGFNRLDVTVDKMWNVAKPQKWRSKIDEILTTL